jgi:hypothetical protein
MALPAWLLYDGPKLVASVRAEDPDIARSLFLGAGLFGTHMRRSLDAR